MARGELADHSRDIGAIEGAERNDAVVRAQAPGRPELGPRGREDEERRLRAALCESLHEVERGRVGPVQVLEGERHRLRARPGQNPGGHRRELPSPELLGRQIGGAARRRRDVDERRQQRGMYVGIEADQLQGVLEVGEAPAGRASRRHRNAGVPIRRSGAEACSAAVATTTIRPRCGASRRGARGTPRRAATCRCRARRRSARTAPRRDALAPSGASRCRVPRRGRPAASARASGPVARRRWRARCGRAAPFRPRLSVHARLCPRRRKDPAICRCTPR